MKKGEKIALWLAFVSIVGLMGLAALLEFRQTDTGKDPNVADARTGSTDANRGFIPAGINPNALPDPQAPGARALTLYCVQCHELPVPAMHSANEWVGVLQRMRGYMQARRGGMLSRLAVPSQLDWSAMDAYLKQHAQKPIDASQFNDIESAAAQAFLTTCSRCHTAPAPEQHRAGEWPRIVVRMKANMSAAGMAPPDSNTTDLIVSFLSKHSG